MTKRKRPYDPVKQVKKLSRELLKSRRGKVIQSERRKLLEKSVIRESREQLETVEEES